MHYHHQFFGAVVRGAGYAAGRDAFHTLGWVGVVAFVLISMLVSAGTKRR